MSRKISIRRTAVLALAAGALMVGLHGSAGAAIPKTGYYSGATSQAKSVSFKVFKYGSFDGPVRKLYKVTATMQLTCASGEVKDETYIAYITFGGKVNRFGRFGYAYRGFSIRGRFTTPTSARGTLSWTDGDCTAANVTWNAKKS